MYYKSCCHDKFLKSLSFPTFDTPLRHQVFKARGQFEDDVEDTEEEEVLLLLLIQCP
jgi:hypothetical protein